VDPLKENGSGKPAPPPRRLDAAEIFRLYLVLQVAAGLTLGAAFLLLAALRPLLGSPETPFLRSWLATFVLAPVTFVPTLALWSRWASRRVGRRSGWLRFVVEIAFFLEIVASLLLQRIA
jgi:hypothetical protein